MLCPSVLWKYAAAMALGIVFSVAVLFWVALGLVIVHVGSGIVLWALTRDALR